MNCKEAITLSDEGDEFICPLCQAKNILPGGGGGSSIGSNEIPGWLIYVAILVLINILSAAFDWGFWIY